MRMNLLPLVSCLALVAASPALAAQVPAPAPAQAAAPASVTDAELAQFSAAMKAVQPIAEALNGAAPTAEQQAQMAEAIAQSGLALERFNAISTAVSGDAVVRARLAVAETPPSPAGSAAAAVTDAELAQFSTAMSAVQPIAVALNGAAPDAAQQAQMAEAISGSGLALERFNAISAAVSQDEHLRARLQLADARRAG